MDVFADFNPVLQMLVIMSMFSILPFMFCCMTSFLRFTIVFSMLKTALGTQQVPPSIVIIGLSMILTFYTMGGVFQKMYDMGSVPYIKNHNMMQTLDMGSKPLKEFMMKQTRESDLAFFIEISNKQQPKSPEDITIWQVAPAYILSELKTAFTIGFVVYLPFLVIDIVVSSVLVSMGMMFLPPTMIALPFKLIMFVMVDGWYLIVKSLVESFVT